MRLPLPNNLGAFFVSSLLYGSPSTVNGAKSFGLPTRFPLLANRVDIQNEFDHPDLVIKTRMVEQKCQKRKGGGEKPAARPFILSASVVGTNEDADCASIRDQSPCRRCRGCYSTHLTTLTTSTAPCTTASSASIHPKHGFLPSQNESSSMVQLFFFGRDSLQAAPSRVSHPPKRQSDRCMLQSLAKNVIIKVVIQNLVRFLDVKLQETQENAEKTAADAVAASNNLECSRSQKVSRVYCLVVRVESQLGSD